jgi:hypothetical protein
LAAHPCLLLFKAALQPFHRHSETLAGHTCLLLFKAALQPFLERLVSLHQPINQGLLLA